MYFYVKAPAATRLKGLGSDLVEVTALILWEDV